MIYVNEKTREFHLTNGLISYVFRVTEDSEILEQLYYGEAIHPYNSFEFLVEREIRPGNNLYESSYTSSLEHIKQEIPVYGTTDFRYPALDVEYPTGDHISHFRYQSYKITQGKKSLPGLPTSFGRSEEVEVLTIFLKDDYSQLFLELHYAIYKNLPLLTRQNQIYNEGNETIFLKSLMSMSLDLPLPNEGFDWIHLAGAWARETQFNRDKVVLGVNKISSTRGASSHIHNPFLALCAPDTNENQGIVYGFNLIYSGNFVGQLELDTYGILRVQMGINPFQFNWQLKAGEKFISPEAVMTFSKEGLNGMSHIFHDFYRNHLISPRWVYHRRPILINNWEATYFEFNEEKLLNIAKKAKALGIELFVLDDGWFGKRNSDNGSLGDWVPDLNKLPQGISSLSKKIKNLGLKFGLWFEPEMVSKDSHLYRQHPNWVVGNPEKNISHGRNQYVLDFSQKAVVEDIFNQIDDILKNAEISYLKWDMNRYISEAFSQSLPREKQGEFFHRYILGVYDLYEKLLEKYPDLFIESCAGGGGRLDPGLLYYAPQTWISDDTDAVERLKIQTGASLVYPLSTLGSHVSQVPNHQVGRVTSLKMRGDVALFGTFGYELDITQLNVKEELLIKEQVKTAKLHQELILTGDFYRLFSSDEKNQWGWMVVSKDQKKALVGCFKILAEANPGYCRILLKGLVPDKLYHFSSKKVPRYGHDLMSVGLVLGENYAKRTQEFWERKLPGDFYSCLFYLEEV